MEFEVKGKDLCGRVGLLEVRGKRVETPLFLPVVDPRKQSITAEELSRKFSVDAIFTNAYLIYKSDELKREALRKGIHGLLNFDGVIATDSGAYQSYIYGEVEVTPSVIESFQEQIHPDMAVILDLPVSLYATYEEAERNVLETLRRAKLNIKRRRKLDVFWFGPVHGAHHLPLVEQSASAMAKLDFDIYAIGSVVEALLNYRFELHVDMIMAAKMHLPLNKPLHVFGIGHPIFFSLPVALGCDMFDSAAYALFAREDRYMTEHGTVKVQELTDFPCVCEVCTSYKPMELRSLLKRDREKLLAMHNLYVCISEVRRIKQAIKDGRLWEFIEFRARGHPRLLRALWKLRDYRDYIEKFSPITKRRGIFFFGSSSLARPEVVRHVNKMRQNYVKPLNVKSLLLVPSTDAKPFHRSRLLKKMLDILKRVNKAHTTQVVVYTVPFGVIPLELDEVFPLSQFEVGWVDDESVDFVGKQVKEFILRQDFEMVIFLNDGSKLASGVLKTCHNVRDEVLFQEIRYEGTLSEDGLGELVKILEGSISKSKH